MSQKYLIQYGNYVLSNQRFGVNIGDHYSSVIKETQYQPGARSNGATVLNTRDKERSISLKGTLRPNNGNLEQNIEDLDYLFGLDNQLFRIVPEYIDLTPNITTANCTLSGDAANLGTDSRDIQFAPTSITFDADVSSSGGDVATMRVVPPTAVDLSAYTDTGAFELALKIPNPEYVTSVNLRVGNDGSNYYEYSFNSDYQGNEIQYGWNWFSIPWGSDALPTGQSYVATVSETGTVDDTQIDYILMQINYSSSGVDIEGCAFGGCLWTNERRARNFPSYLDSAVEKTQQGGQQNNLMPWGAKLINYTGYSRGTHEILASEDSNVSGTTTASTYFLGNQPPKPLFDFDIVSVTEITSLTLNNSRDNLTPLTVLPTSVTAGDIISLGGLDSRYDINGSPLDFIGAIPSYFPGHNKTQINFVGGSPVTYSTNVPTVGAGFTDDISNNQEQAGTSFVPTSTGALTEASYYARGFAVPGTITLVMEVYSSSGGLPDSSLDQTNQYLSYNTGNTRTTWTAQFLQNVSLTSGTEYWFVVTYISGPTATSRIGLRGQGGFSGVDYVKRTFGAPIFTLGSIDSTFDFNYVIAEALEVDLSFTQSYYPLYK